VKKLIATVLTVAAALCTPAAFGDETRVLGESLDSGLGNVSKEELRRIVSAYEAATQRQR